MSRSLSFILALLFVGLQIASLSHGAHFGFQSHAHAHQLESRATISAQIVGAIDLSVTEDREEDRSQNRCDVAVFCEKLNKWVGVDGLMLSADFSPIRSTHFVSQSAPQARVANTYPRGPPVFLLS